MHGDNQTGLFRVTAILHLLLLRVNQSLHVATSVLLFFSHYIGFFRTEILVVLVHLLALALNLLGYLLVNSEFTISFPLSFTALSHEHLPATHVVHRFVLVGQQVAFHQRTVAHGYAASPGLQRPLATDIRQTDL